MYLMEYNNMKKKYVIIKKEDVDSIEFKHIIETSKTTLRYSLNGEKVIVKFMGETPEFLVGCVEYSHNEIIELINDPANGWIEE